MLTLVASLAPMIASSVKCQGIAYLVAVVTSDPSTILPQGVFLLMAISITG